MPSVKIFKQTGEDAGTMQLVDSVFGVEVNDVLLHEVVVAQLANKRQGTKSALTRAEVRGGGKKPWRQKKTGRARQGSTRSPQWTGGGVVFAPKPRLFKKKINRQAMELALKSALSAKVRDGEFLVLDALKIAAPKTKEVATVINNLKLEGSVLIVYAKGGSEADLLRAGRNIPELTLTSSELINVYDIISHRKVVVVKDAVKKIEEAYAQ